MTQTPVIQLTLGVNQPALSIPGVDQIRGVLIDNPSGAWLLFRTTNEYIPPYTINFMRSFEFGHTSVAIEFPSTGPAGQVSTLQGDKVRVQLFSDPIGSAQGSAAGTPFIEQFTPVEMVTHTETVIILDASGFELLPAVANKRYRIVGYSFTTDSIGADGHGVSGALCALTNTGVDLIIYDHIGPKPLNYGTNVVSVIIDYPVGSNVQCTMECDWADIDIVVTVLYQLI